MRKLALGLFFALALLVILAVGVGADFPSCC